MKPYVRIAATTAAAIALAACGVSGDSPEANQVLPLTEANSPATSAAPDAAGTAGPSAANTSGAAPAPAPAPAPVSAAPPQPTGAPPPAAPAPAPAPGSDAPAPALEQDYMGGNDQGHPPG